MRKRDLLLLPARYPPLLPEVAQTDAFASSKRGEAALSARRPGTSSDQGSRHCPPDGQPTDVVLPAPTPFPLRPCHSRHVAPHLTPPPIRRRRGYPRKSPASSLPSRTSPSTLTWVVPGAQDIAVQALELRGPRMAYSYAAARPEAPLPLHRCHGAVVHLQLARAAKRCHGAAINSSP